MPKNYFCCGLLCCYNGLDCESTMICCKSQGECICLVNQCCCAYTGKTKKCGPMTPNLTNRECFKIGYMCGTCALKRPQVLCSGASQVCCCVNVYSLPFDKDYINGLVFGCCCVQCVPTFQVMKEYPSGSAINKIRGTGTPLPQAMSR